MKITDNTIKSTVHYFRNELSGIYEESEVEQLIQICFSHYFNLDRVELNCNADRLLTESDLVKLIHAVKRLKKSEPLAYILEEWEFYGLPFQLSKDVLIPRPETEELVQLIINESKSKNNSSILDIGTGSGCIAIALKKHLSDYNVKGVDVSKEALKIAKENAVKNNTQVSFEWMDILTKDSSNVENQYDIIVSNPPYITEKEKKQMHQNVLDYEPHLALFVANNAPLLFYKAIADFALKHLTTNGKLYFEINEAYGKEVSQLLRDRNFKNVNIVKDINEKNRVVSCNL